MRQPEVARLGGLLLALLLFAPVVPPAWRLLLAAAFLAEFLSAGASRPLSALTPAPVRAPLAVAGAVADRHHAGGGPPLVLVHGYAPDGKDDPRVVQAAGLLARAGFDVAVPTIPGLTQGRLRPEDAEPVVAALRARPGPAAMVAVSVGAGPALLAAADARVRDRIRVLLGLGGYASAPELLRFFVTGEYGYGAEQGRVVHDPEVVRHFLVANAELLDPRLTQALGSADAGRARDALGRLPPQTRAMLDALSPERVIHDVRARLVLVHGRHDPAIPYTESLRLEAARPQGTSVVLVGVLGHVEASTASLPGLQALDLLRLTAVVYGLVASF